MTAVLLGPGAGRVIGVGADRMVHEATSEMDAFSLVEYFGAAGAADPAAIGALFARYDTEMVGSPA